jgi:hypothetical protein
MYTGIYFELKWRTGDQTKAHKFAIYVETAIIGKVDLLTQMQVHLETSFPIILTSLTLGQKGLYIKRFSNCHDN